MVPMQTGDDGDKNQEANMDAATEDNSETAGRGDASLEETAEREREYLRGRLREELRREPSEAELDEWLREHTEGY